MESNVSLQPIPKTMEQVVSEFFELKPEERPLYFRGYRPHNFFRTVNTDTSRKLVLGKDFY